MTLDGTGNPTDVIAANNKNGLLFFLATGSLMESLNPCLLSLPLERFVFLREYNSKLYYLSPYFFSKLIVDLATDIIVPIIFSAVSKPNLALNNYFITLFRSL